MIALTPKLYGMAVGALAVAAAVGGAYWRGTVVGARAAEADYYAGTVANVLAARQAERELWAGRIAREQERTRGAAESIQRATHDVEGLKKAIRELRARPIPVRIVRMLESNSGGGTVPNSAGIARGVDTGGPDPTRKSAEGDAGGTIEADVLAAAIRENAGRHERNIGRLNSCRAAYADVRASLIAANQ